NATIEPIELFQELSSCISFIEQQIKENKVVILITITSHLFEKDTCYSWYLEKDF
ncbi:unnamed protein product, partial [Rotaria sordida]